MNIKEKWKHFWNVTLGPDCAEEVDIMDSNNPEYRVLQASLKKVNQMYDSLNSPSGNSTKASKGNSNRNPVVDKVNVKPIKRASGKGKSTSRTVNEEIGER